MAKKHKTPLQWPQKQKFPPCRIIFYDPLYAIASQVRKKALVEMCPCRVKTDISDFWERVLEMLDDPSDLVRYQVRPRDVIRDSLVRRCCTRCATARPRTWSTSWSRPWSSSTETPAKTCVAKPTGANPNI